MGAASLRFRNFTLQADQPRGEYGARWAREKSGHRSLDHREMLEISIRMLADGGA